MLKKDGGSGWTKSEYIKEKGCDISSKNSRRAIETSTVSTCATQKSKGQHMYYTSGMHGWDKSMLAYMHSTVFNCQRLDNPIPLGVTIAVCLFTTNVDDGNSNRRRGCTAGVHPCTKTHPCTEQKKETRT